MFEETKRPSRQIEKKTSTVLKVSDQQEMGAMDCICL